MTALKNNNSKTHSLTPRIKTLKEILFLPELSIPEYQRPYKWQLKHAKQLIDDILYHQNKSAYRLGTLVIHRDQEEKLNIVDGQQRLITLTLLAHALLEQNTNLEEFYPTANLALKGAKINHPISKRNIAQNYSFIKNEIKAFDAPQIHFLFKKCEFVFIELSDLSEAFQFFDSQNARGKDLEPHDLLKAFHLRAMSSDLEAERIASVTSWEKLDSVKLAKLFSDYLFRIRNWSKGQSARFFSKNDVPLFKGIALDETFLKPFMIPYRINHYYIDEINDQAQHKILQKKTPYPFQLDQIIINGQRFFEYIQHYAHEFNSFLTSSKATYANDLIQWLQPKSLSVQIISMLNSYKARHRTGDKYVRNLFDCCLLFYIDKFGKTDLERVIEKFFLWSYSIRIEKQAVQLASIDNAAMDNNGFIRLIRESVNPKSIISRPIPIPEANNNTDKTREIISLFKQLHHWKV